MLLIDEPLPNNTSDAEAVLYVRRRLRSRLRNGNKEEAPHCLAMLFGFPWEHGRRKPWVEAAQAQDPIQAGAAVAAHARKLTGNVALLGHDQAHVADCRLWLLQRKDAEPSFRGIHSSDLTTLLELSKAIDLAVATGRDADGNQRPVPILIQGETGTGKELLAKAIHEIWARTQPPKANFRVLHVAGKPEGVIADELFGHRKGAYTGAAESRLGRLEAADGGTLLIDEIGDLPMSAQLQLLRFLQDGKVSQIGTNAESSLHVRIIAATWHDLEADVKKGMFREDLLYRLRSGSSLCLPPLRERARFFFDDVDRMLLERGAVGSPKINRSAREALMVHAWPGNLRELAGVLDEAVPAAEGATIRVEHLPARLQQAYLSRPLDQRAIGFLADEADEQTVSAELAEHRVWRLIEVCASYDHPALDPQLSAIGQFLSKIDDGTEEHKATAVQVNAWLTSEQEARRHAAIADFFGKLAQEDVPKTVQEALLAYRVAITKTHDEAQTRADKAKEAAKLADHPWLKMFRELQATPLLQGATPGELANAFLIAFNALRAFVPEWLGIAREELLKGGLSQLRERILEELRKPKEEQEVIESPSPGEERLLARNMTKNGWLELSRLASLKDARDRTKFDPITIKKYFKEHRIHYPWSTHTDQTSKRPKNSQPPTKKKRQR